MEVKAIASSSLVISKELGDSGIGTLITVSFAGASATLIPITHDSTYDTQLKYLTNPEIINAASGLKENASSEDLIFADAVNTVDKIYFIDYVVYVGAAGATMLNQDLKVELDKDTIGEIPDMRKAVSIDFYINDSADTLGTYKGTLNLVGLNNEINDTLTTKDTVVLLENGSIYENDEPSLTEFLRVTMRVYFDGALLKTPDNPLTLGENESVTFINTIDVNTTSLEVAIKFTAQDHTD